MDETDISSGFGLDFSALVGPQDNGTYVPPVAAQPYNQPWDTGGGTQGDYGRDVLGVLTQGIGAWSQYKRDQQFLDYRRYEATNGGLFTQGQAAPGLVPAGQKNNGLAMLLVIGLVVLVATR